MFMLAIQIIIQNEKHAIKRYASFVFLKIAMNAKLMMISEYYSLGINKQHARILSNIFLKNHCLKSTPSCAKALKLAS